MVIAALTAMMLAGCEQEQRAPRPDPATFGQPAIDTAVEPLSDFVEEEVPTGANRAPVVRQARIDPKKPRRDEDLQVLADLHDPDGDLLRTLFRWFINEKPLSGATGKKLTSGPYKKGDVVQVEINVTDGPNDTVYMTEGVTIQNSPPVMIKPSKGAANLDGLVIDVKDPDDDPLTFSLEDAPPGLSIDSEGVLHFSASDEIKETTSYTTRVMAEDPEGERAIWELKLTLNAAKAASRKFTPTGRSDATAEEED